MLSLARPACKAGRSGLIRGPGAQMHIESTRLLVYEPAFELTGLHEDATVFFVAFVAPVTTPPRGRAGPATMAPNDSVGPGRDERRRRREEFPFRGSPGGTQAAPAARPLKPAF